MTGAQFSADTALTIYAKSLDTTETTIANVASQTIQATGASDGAYLSYTCEISTGKYISIWQKETGASVAAGIIAACTSFNGSTWSI